MLDKTETVKEAQKYLAKGAIDKAISELEKLVKESPDGNIFNMIGDLYLKKGIQKSGIDCYQMAANYFRQEGFSQKAQALYKKVLNLNPLNTDALYAFGELSEEKGLITDAIKYYLATADLLTKEGRKEKILQIYEKILSLSPANIPLRIKVAEIFIKEGLQSDAAREYLHIARIHEETGDHTKSKEFYQKAIDLHPRSKESVLGLSHLFEKTGEMKKAAAQIKDAAGLFPDDADILFRCTELSLKIDDTGSARQYLVRIIEKDQKNVKAHRMLGDLYLKAGSTEKAWEQYLPVLDDILTDRKYEDAISLLETFKPIDPVETGKRLISLFRQLEEKDRVCDELVSLGDYYASQGMEDDARSWYAETLQIDPEHSLARMRVAPPHSGPEPEPIQEPHQTGPAEIEIPDVALSTEETAEAPDLATISEPEAIASGPVGMPESEEKKETEQILIHGEKSFEEIITEVDIFSRYGLLNEAQKLLEGLKRRFPENLDVHQRLKTLYTDLHEKESAVTECIILSELYKRNGDDISSEEMLKKAYEINPEDPRMAKRGYAQSIEPTSFAAPSAEGFGEAVSGTEPNIEDYEEELAEADFYARQGLTTEAVNILEKLQKLFPENRDVIERLQALGQLAPLSDSQEMTGGMDLSDTFDIPEPSETSGEFKVAETVGSAEGFEMTGETEQGGGSELPGNMGMFGELELDEKISSDVQAEQKAPEEPAQQTAPEEISLTEASQAETLEETKESAYEDFTFSDSDLVEAQEMPEPSLDNDVLEIFQEFKKGLEKEIGDEDSETHYNLGIAYKEMGLVDDAIKEFQTSKKDAKRFLQSSTMLGVCYLEKGLYTLAIDVLKKAMEAMKDKDESYWALSYELAEAHEKNRNLKEALALYTEIYGWNANFRSISEKMGQLQSQAPKAAETEKAPGKEKPKERKDRVSYL
jgi:tetratricopeptide (TPR) repeat protein